tara:strand:- start:281 stop:541 length:261 start_codon:yes stop_codon:yes gene_type:complete
MTTTGTFHNRLLTLILIHPGLQPGGLADRMDPTDHQRIGSLSTALEAAHAGMFIAQRCRSGRPVREAPGWHVTEIGLERLNLYGSD